MKRYSVKQLSDLGSITVRTLHHYDRIGLLKPAVRSDSGYRYYGREELLRLQQILFYRELGFPLKSIGHILDDPSFDPVAALQHHRRELQQRVRRTRQLLMTIDKTISELQNAPKMLTDKELYEGFKPEEVQPMREEVISRWGQKELEQSETRLRKMNAEDFRKLKERGEAVNRKLAQLMDLNPEADEVQQAIAEHHEVLKQYSEVSMERYRCLGQLYTQDDRFRANYDKYRAGLADFLCLAINVYTRR